MKAILSAICLSLLLIGCATNSSKSAREVQVFKIEQPPTQKYTVLKTLTDDGTEEEEPEITAEFVQRARKLGADAILIHPKKQDGTELDHPFSFKMKFSYLYKADAVKFE